jgi:hypothetical protein
VLSGESSHIRNSQSEKDCARIDSIVAAINFSCLYVVVMIEKSGILFSANTKNFGSNFRIQKT